MFIRRERGGKKKKTSRRERGRGELGKGESTRDGGSVRIRGRGSVLCTWLSIGRKASNRGFPSFRCLPAVCRHASRYLRGALKDVD